MLPLGTLCLSVGDTLEFLPLLSVRGTFSARMTPRSGVILTGRPPGPQAWSSSLCLRSVCRPGSFQHILLSDQPRPGSLLFVVRHLMGNYTVSKFSLLQTVQT